LSPVAGEALRIWARIALALERGEALPEDARQYLMEAAQAIDLASRGQRRKRRHPAPPRRGRYALEPAVAVQPYTAAEAAADVQRILGLTPSDFAAAQAAVRNAWVIHLMAETDWSRNAEARAAFVAQLVDLDPRQVYRIINRRRHRS
jgi:hypothetical protein